MLSMAKFTPEELEEMRRADEEIEADFCLTPDEKAASIELDASAKVAGATTSKKAYYWEHREHELARRKRWYRENRAYALAYQAAYRAEHLEQTKACQRRWRAANPGYDREYMRKYRQKNRDRLNDYQR